MYTYYCIKCYFSNGASGYYRLGWQVSTNINDSSFFDTADEAYSFYRKNLMGSNFRWGGGTLERCTVVKVDSAYPI